MGVLTGTVPIVLYSIQRIRRFLRAHLNRDDVKIVKATVRPGKGGGPDGALTYLQISKPRALWQNWPGAYAFINMPEYAYFQWHPFTICSGKDSDTVDFIIAGVGDWTQTLASRCLNAVNDEANLPRIILDGPCTAP